MRKTRVQCENVWLWMVNQRRNSFWFTKPANARLKPGLRQGKRASGGGVSLGRYKVWCWLPHLKNVRIRSIYLKGGFPGSMSVSLFRSRSGEQIEWPSHIFENVEKSGEKNSCFLRFGISLFVFLSQGGADWMGREQIRWAEDIFSRISTNQAPPKNLWSVPVLRFKSMFCDQPYQYVQVHD